MAALVEAVPVVAGEARGLVLASVEPLSLWGGYDQATGEIIDRRHPLSGQNAAGKVLVIPFTRGSSSTPSVLLEAIRAGTAPAAIISLQVDSFFALTSIVAEELYGKTLPVLTVDQKAFDRLIESVEVEVRLDGRLYIR